MSVKIRKGKWIGRNGETLFTILPKWRNWIRRRSITTLVDAPMRNRRSIKEARLFLLEKYKEMGKMLVTLQGQDY